MTVEVRATTNNTSQKAGSSSKPSSTKAPQSSARTPTKSTTGDDTVSLTSSATQLQALSAQVSELPVVDAQLVSDVQVSLAAGTFQVAPVEVADNLIAQEKELALLQVKE